MCVRVHYVLFSLCNDLTEKRAGCLTLIIIFLLLYVCLCLFDIGLIPLYLGIMGWSVGKYTQKSESIVSPYP